MPKCGCAGDACACSIQPGPGLLVTGTGTASSPFVISLSPAPGDQPVSAAGPLDLSAYGGSAVVSVLLNANATSVVLPSSSATHLDLIITQGAGGSKTITWGSQVKWPGGTVPVLSTANNAIDWITLVRSGSAGTWVGVLTAKALA